MLSLRRLAAWTAVAVFVTATAAALLQPVHPNTYKPRTGLTRLLYPTETNPYWRLPQIRADLNDLGVQVGAGGHTRLWAVGRGGAILHSPDGGRCWEAQGPWKPAGSERACGPRNLWDRMVLIPEALGAEKGPVTKPPVDTPVVPIEPGGYDQAARLWRDALKAAGYDPGEPPKDPSLYDKALAAAVAAYQRDSGLAADGIVGPLTRQLLDTLMARQAGESDAFPVQRPIPVTIAAVPEPPVPEPAPAPPDLHAVQFIDAQTGWVVGSDGTILNTADGGATWTAHRSGGDTDFFAIQFVDPNTGWAVGGGGIIRKTVNGGATWNRQTSGTDVYLSVVQFMDTKTGWVAGGGGLSPDAAGDSFIGTPGFILQTEDGGKTWEELMSVVDGLADVQFLDPQTAWAVGNPGIILKTANGGARWTAQESGTQTSLSAVKFIDPNTGWAVGSEGVILKTTNGGAKWAEQESDTHADLYTVKFLNATTGWALGERGTILKTIDGGKSWMAQTRGARASLFEVQFLDPQIGWVVGGGGTILKSLDGGATWRPQVSGTNTWLFAADFPDAAHGWVVGTGGTVLKTADGGATWLPQPSGTKADLYEMEFLDGKTGWAGGEMGAFLKTTDGGTTWALYAGLFDHDLIALEFLDSETGWAVEWAGPILKTTDGGRTWTRASQQTEVDAEVAPVQLPNAERGWTLGRKGTILWTSDEGATWQARSRFSENGFSKLYFLDAKIGWVVGSEGTILKTTDGGATWNSPLAPYSIGPARWYWVANLLSIGLLGYSAWPQRPRVTERSVADLLASDRPLRHRGEPDALDLGSIAASLSEFLRNRNTEAPLTIAVTGDWGSGKTSLMNLLFQDLKDNNFRPVWFNAWHHQKGEQILASLFAHIREQSIPPLLSWRGLRFRWRLLARRGAPVWLLVIVLSLVLGASLGYLGDLLAKYSMHVLEVARDPEQLWYKDWRPVTKVFAALAGIAGSGFGLMRTMQGFGLDPQRLVTINPQTRKTQGLDPGARARFTRQFGDVTECLKPRKMVIFIDDLDRCSKESLIEVLEAVNFLASSGDCFIVLGMSPRWVEGCVGLTYNDLAQAMAEEFPGEDNNGERSAEQRRRFARNYLEKLINIEVPMPDLDQERAGVLVAPETMEAGEQSRPWRVRWLDAAQPLSRVWKPILVIAAVVYGVWFGLDLLHKPEPAPPVQDVRWSTSDVKLLIPSLPASREPQETPFAVRQKNLTAEPASPVQAADPASAAEPARGRLAQTLSELLGVEISIQADRESPEQGLVLLEYGSDNRRWHMVLREPSAPVADSAPGSEGGEKPQPAPEPKDTESQPFELRPGLRPEPTIPAWVLVAAAVLLLYAASRSSRRSATEITADSTEFRQALKIWLPWLMAKQGTPRAVKRFVNRLRYVAIRLRAGAEQNRFPEPNTVALAAINFFDESWLTHDHQHKLVTGESIDTLLKPGEGVAAHMDAEQVRELAGALGACVDAYQTWADDPGVSEEERARRGPWPPSVEHRSAFLSVISEKRVTE